MTNESWIPAPSKPTPMDTSNWSLKGTQRKLLCKKPQRNSWTLRNTQENVIVKKQINKNLFFFIRVVFKGPPPLHPIGLWTLSPRFLRGFHPPWAHDRFFQLVSGFPAQITWLPVPMSPRSYFPHWSAVSHTGNDMTSSICSRPIRSQHYHPNGPALLLVMIMDLIGICCISDADECNATVPVCDIDAICRNTVGSFVCICKTGFTGNGFSCTGKEKTSKTGFTQ